MEFVSFPSYYPDQQKLRELARQFHSLGPDVLHRFFTALFAGELPTDSFVLSAIERPADFDLCDADASELPPSVVQLVPGKASKPRRKRWPAVRRGDEP